MRSPAGSGNRRNNEDSRPAAARRLLTARERRRYANPAARMENCHVTRYAGCVIKTFADRHTHEIYTTGRSRRFAPDLARRARRKIEYVDLASRIDDLKVPPGNRLHRLGEDREGQYAIRINDQQRVCFRFVDGDAYDVEITDYH